MIAIDPKDSNIVYVAAQGPLWGPGGDRGLFKTTDAGSTWSILDADNDLGFRYVNDIVVSPIDGNRVYAATSTAVMRSLDGGTARNFTRPFGVATLWEPRTSSDFKSAPAFGW